MKNLKLYTDKVALVTGGGEGLGRALCMALVMQNARVVCTDLKQELLDHTRSLIQSAVPGATIETMVLDVRDREQVVEVIDKVRFNHGRIDYLFNNAGISIAGEIRDLDSVHWRNVIGVNLFGMISMATEVYRTMLEAKQGHIVNIASISGLTEYTALTTPYGVSKHGAVTFSKHLRLEALDFGVKVTTVCPGAISTNIGENMKFINSGDGMKERSLDFIAKGIAPNQAAQIILKGVAKNKKMVIFPGSFKTYYHVTKIFPFLDKILTIRLIRLFRDQYRLQK